MEAGAVFSALKASLRAVAEVVSSLLPRSALSAIEAGLLDDLTQWTGCFSAFDQTHFFLGGGGGAFRLGGFGGGGAEGTGIAAPSRRRSLPVSAGTPQGSSASPSFRFRR